MNGLNFEPRQITEVFDKVGLSAKLDVGEICWLGECRFPHVTNTAQSNSIARLIPKQPGRTPNDGGAITLGVDTQVVAFQPHDFYTGVKVIVLRSDHLSRRVAASLLPILRKQVEKFAWANKASTSRLLRTRIMVPVTEAGGVDWEGMERFGGDLLASASAAAIVPLAHLVGGDLEGVPAPLAFEPRLITAVFDEVRPASAQMDAVRVDRSGVAEFPYVTRSAGDNGIADVIPRQSIDPNPGITITVGLDTQTVAFQQVAFYAGQNVQMLRASSLSAASATILIPLVRSQLEKFSWGGNGATLGRLRKTQMMVPVSESGEIDWRGMERHGRWLLSRAAAAAASGATRSI